MVAEGVYTLWPEGPVLKFTIHSCRHPGRHVVGGLRPVRTLAASAPLGAKHTGGAGGGEALLRIPRRALHHRRCVKP